LGIDHCSNNSTHQPTLRRLRDSDNNLRIVLPTFDLSLRKSLPCSFLQDRLHDLIPRVNLLLPTEGLERYKSASQRARIGTEAWGAFNFFCPVCKSPRLDIASRNTAAIDYLCPRCDSPFQLKSQSRPFGNRIVDAAYSEMKRAILSDNTPNLYVLHYDLTQWAVRTVILIPHFAFALSAIECRPALGPAARRAGWIGCNILLNKIPADARIPIVESGKARAASEVRQAYNHLRPLENLKVETRGWTLDVLNVVRSLNKKEFSLADVYAHADDLAKLHPKNAHIPDKIRQQLQHLRDLKLLEFLSPGSYRLI
jgi:type II restriction enzyme